ncbi:T9SS type A sorting domain-containing protein [Flavobacterium flavipallidum]|uniref:T9SS type A sorting domain-containing protein n=1 Tax=Flavobacterium flavipallidum TaxID=3139140 RepID=A0ABU9HN67_9FLAO
MKYLLLLFTFPFYGQVLHHQMLSSQGTTKEITSKVIVSQTIGQQSIVGNSTNGAIVIQGFQQSLWSSYIAQNEKTTISAQTFPNPFKDVVNFQFSESLIGELSIYIFDVSGRLVHKEADKIDDSIFTINLSKIPRGEYLVQLNNKSFTYYTKIIKL